MKYHIIKATRLYFGMPYCGPASDNLPAEADTLEEAIRLLNELNVRNPVGWVIMNSETRKRIYEIEGEV